MGRKKKDIEQENIEDTGFKILPEETATEEIKEIKPVNDAVNDTIKKIKAVKTYCIKGLISMRKGEIKEIDNKLYDKIKSKGGKIIDVDR